MSNKSVIHHVGKIALVVAILGAVALGIGLWKRQAIIATYVDVVKPTPPPPTVVLEPETKPVVEANVPEEFNLAVPFVKQAPLGVWDHMHEETCEEAAVLTVHAYYEKLSLTDDEVEQELLKIVELENKLFGFFEDTSVSLTIQFAKKMYGFTKSVVLENPTLDQIKKEIFAGRPVLVPADGKLLKNPNFKNGGPLYHIIVLRGWNKDGFFVNDPGTRKGENYFYTNAVINTAMHDWNADDHLANGPKRAFVLYK